MTIDLHAPNPMHRESGPNDAWSTINTRENYQGVMSPLGATLWLPVSDLAVNGTFYDLGVLRRSEVTAGRTPEESSSSVFYGRYTASINYFRRISDLIPGQSGAAFEKQVFGSSREGAPDTSSRRRYHVVAVKAPLAVVTLPRRIRRMSRDLDAWWRFSTSDRGMARPFETRISQALKNLEYAMRVHVAGTFVAQAVFDALGGLAESAGRPGLHLELSTGYGQMVETALVAALNDVALGRLSMPEFLAEYGFRCAGEIEVSNPSWRERPDLVQRMVDKYRTTPQRQDPAATAMARAQVRLQAEHDLLTALPRWKRPLGRLLIRLAATYIPLREEGKAALAKGFDAARAACAARGAELAASGVIEDPRDVYYLTIDEIRGTPLANARDLVAQRRELRAAYEQIDVPDAWVGPPVPVALTTTGDRDAGTVLGVAGAHGVAEGFARVLASADDLDDLEPDEILVCRTTDPSWASAFHLAAGAVIDIGSTASHGAIVAREMGIPCVIGTGDGTRVLQTGDLIRVDGGAGEVTVLERARASENAS
ncbi:PEP-utilizing enzyme [Mycolicibacterium elephantis]